MGHAPRVETLKLQLISPILTFKSRMMIENLFDGLKNVLDAGSSSMQDEEALQGWMFINHVPPLLSFFHCLQPSFESLDPALLSGQLGVFLLQYPIKPLDGGQGYSI